MQTTSNPCQLLTHARGIKPTFDAFITAVAAKTGGDVRLAKLKSMWRIAEKIVLRPREEKCREPLACKIRDVVRGAILFTHVASMSSALDLVLGCDEVLLRAQVRAETNRVLYTIRSRKVYKTGPLRHYIFGLYGCWGGHSDSDAETHI